MSFLIPYIWTNSTQAPQTTIPETSIVEIRNRALVEPLDNLNKIGKISLVLTTLVRARNTAKSLVRWAFRSTWDVGAFVGGKAFGAVRSVCHKVSPNSPERIEERLKQVGCQVLSGALFGLEQINYQLNKRCRCCNAKPIFMSPNEIREGLRQMFAPASPASLVKTIKDVEKLRRRIPRVIYPSIKCLALPLQFLFKLYAVPLNIFYKCIYKKDLFVTPQISFKLPDGLLDDGKGEYCTPAQRLDKLFIQNLPLSQGILDLPVISLEEMKNQLLFKKLRDLVEGGAKGIVQNDMHRFFNNIFHKALERTTEKRIALIEAVEGLLLRMILDTVGKQMPSTSVCLREVTLIFLEFFFLESKLMAPLDAITSGLTAQLPYPLNQIEKLPDGVEIISKCWGSVCSQLAELALIPTVGSLQLPHALHSNFLTNGLAVTGKGLTSLLTGGTKMITEKATDAVATRCLQFGPMAYALYFNEMDRWGKEGNKRIEQFGTPQGLLQLARGEKYEPEEEELQIILNQDENRKQLLGICAEFSFGAFARMCEDEKLGSNPGAFGLLKLGLRSVINSVLQDQANSQIKAIEDKTKVPAQEIPGMREAKLAFVELLGEMKKVFLEEACIELGKEYERQKKDAQMVLQATRENQAAIIRKQAEGIGYVASLLGAEQENATAVAASILNLPGSFFWSNDK